MYCTCILLYIQSYSLYIDSYGYYMVVWVAMEIGMGLNVDIEIDMGIGLLVLQWLYMGIKKWFMDCMCARGRRPNHQCLTTNKQRAKARDYTHYFLFLLFFSSFVIRFTLTSLRYIFSYLPTKQFSSFPLKKISFLFFFLFL